MRAIVAAAMLGLAAPVAAVQPPAVTAPEPDRLQAAHALIELLMPPATRNAMIDGMTSSMLDSTTKGLTASPQLHALFAGDPKAKAVLDAFIVRQQSQTQQMLKDNLPGMIVAMERAYARRFTVAQMHELATFFSTPTGRTYMAQATTIMSDPDVAAWQQRLMSDTMSRIVGETKAMVAELMAAGRAPASP